jgi:hypothetical protein
VVDAIGEVDDGHNDVVSTSVDPTGGTGTVEFWALFNQSNYPGPVTVTVTCLDTSP